MILARSLLTARHLSVYRGERRVAKPPGGRARDATRRGIAQMRRVRSRGVEGRAGRLFFAVLGRRVNATVAAPLGVEGTGASISGVGKAGAFAAIVSLVMVVVVLGAAGSAFAVPGVVALKGN